MDRIKCILLNDIIYQTRTITHIRVFIFQPLIHVYHNILQVLHSILSCFNCIITQILIHRTRISKRSGKLLFSISVKWTFFERISYPLSHICLFLFQSFVKDRSISPLNGISIINTKTWWSQFHSTLFITWLSYIVETSIIHNTWCRSIFLSVSRVT